MATTVQQLHDQYRPDAIDRRLLAAVQHGLPLVSQPYQTLAQELSLDEQDVIERIGALKAHGVIKRWGIVVRHHELGYRANAMVVWDVPDQRVGEVGQCMSQWSSVRLCYRRPRQLPDWPYNLFCMIHGHDRVAVLQDLATMIDSCGLKEFSHEVLFSTRRFKQRGAWYGLTEKETHGKRDAAC